MTSLCLNSRDEWGRGLECGCGVTFCHMVTDHNDTSRLRCSLLGISVVCHNNYQRRDRPHLGRFLRAALIHLVTHVVLISSAASHWPPGIIPGLLLAAGVTCGPHNKLGLRESLGFLNTSLLCISLLWKQEMTLTPSLLLAWCHMTLGSLMARMMTKTAPFYTFKMKKMEKFTNHQMKKLFV